MSDETLRDRIAGVLAETYSPGGRGVQFEDAVAAQAIIDEFGMTVHGDGCGYHEIHGSYDTRFEEG